MFLRGGGDSHPNNCLWRETGEGWQTFGKKQDKWGDLSPGGFPQELEKGKNNDFSHHPPRALPSQGNRKSSAVRGMLPFFHRFPSPYYDGFLVFK